MVKSSTHVTSGHGFKSCYIMTNSSLKMKLFEILYKNFKSVPPYPHNPVPPYPHNPRSLVSHNNLA